VAAGVGDSLSARYCRASAGRYRNTASVAEAVSRAQNRFLRVRQICNGARQRDCAAPRIRQSARCRGFFDARG
jgi:hypothetical protein